MLHDRIIIPTASISVRGVSFLFLATYNLLPLVHWGETKSWYGIPGEDAAKFEAAMKSEAPDLFEAQPDLLFQLVTLMNPDRVKKAGVRVYSCNQRAGEFVITFPKSYHAGFNHGVCHLFSLFASALISFPAELQRSCELRLAGLAPVRPRLRSEISRTFKTTGVFSRRAADHDHSAKSID